MAIMEVVVAADSEDKLILAYFYARHLLTFFFYSILAKLQVLFLIGFKRVREYAGIKFLRISDVEKVWNVDFIFDL